GEGEPSPYDRQRVNGPRKWAMAGTAMRRRGWACPARDDGRDDHPIGRRGRACPTLGDGWDDVHETAGRAITCEKGRASPPPTIGSGSMARGNGRWPIRP